MITQSRNVGAGLAFWSPDSQNSPPLHWTHTGHQLHTAAASFKIGILGSKWLKDPVLQQTMVGLTDLSHSNLWTLHQDTRGPALYTSCNWMVTASWRVLDRVDSKISFSLCEYLAHLPHGRKPFGQLNIKPRLFSRALPPRWALVSSTEALKMPLFCSAVHPCSWNWNCLMSWARCGLKLEAYFCTPLHSGLLTPQSLLPWQLPDVWKCSEKQTMSENYCCL